MVFSSVICYVRSRGPDEFWRKRNILKFAAHFKGRRQNCYSIAVRYVHRALVYATIGRRLKKEDMRCLWTTRLHAACEEHNFTYPLLKEGLTRSKIMLNKKSLSDISIWEPYSFKALTKVAWSKATHDGLAGVKELGNLPSGVISRGMLK